ncbi:MAG: urea transporter [Nitrosomonadales bacterium SCN 54-20]|nr:MAG: urea transporter [Nitrosomonadales bacterium SCN 54-20]
MNWASNIDQALPQPLRIMLRGVGQVIFCSNAVTGLVFLLALYLNEVTAGLAATVGVVSSTWTARFLGYSATDIEAGLYGFNGVLVAVCLLLFLGHPPQLWLYIAGAAMLSSVVLASLIRVLPPLGLPPATAPFVLTGWLFMALVPVLDASVTGPRLSLPDHMVDTFQPGVLSFADWLILTAKGVGQIFFSDKIIVGVLVLIGVAISSLRGALLLAAGAFIGSATSIVAGADKDGIGMGLYGFNSALVTIGIGWVFLEATLKNAILAICAGIFAALCHVGLARILVPAGLPVLASPFLSVLWTVLFLVGGWRRWQVRQKLGNTG